MFKSMIVLAGFAQLGIAATSLAIPRLLGWPEQLARVEKLTRRIFWTYGGYVLGAHVWFSAVSIVWAGELLRGTPLAALVTGLIATWWGVRVVGQFTWYDRAVSETRTLFRVAEVLYVTAFVFVTAVFGVATLHNVGEALR